MKHLLLVLGLALATLSTVSAQFTERNDKTYQDWRAHNLGSDGVYPHAEAYTAGEVIIPNATVIKENAKIWLSIGKWNVGTSDEEFYVRIEGLSYKYDAEGDANFVGLEFIFDNDSANKISFQGEIRSKNSKIYLTAPDGFGEKVRNSKTLWVKIKQYNAVLKFSLSGSAAALTDALNREVKANPFTATENSDNPF